MILNPVAPQDQKNNRFIEYHSDGNNISIDEDNIINEDVPQTFEGRNS